MAGLMTFVGKAAWLIVALSNLLVAVSEYERVPQS